MAGSISQFPVEIYGRRNETFWIHFRRRKTHNSKDLGAEWKLKWTSIESTKLGNYYFSEMLLNV